MVTARLGHLLGLLSLSQHTSAEGELIYRRFVVATVGGAMPRSFGYYCIFFVLAKQAINKFASGLQNPH